MDKNKIKSYLSSNFLTEAKDTAEKPAGLKKTEDIQKANKAINKAATSDIDKVIKANDKTLEANKKTNAKEVKKRKLDKDEQKTHDDVELFQDTMMALDYDSPVDDNFKDRFEKSLAGHSTMGNSNEYANVVPDKVWGGDPKFGQTLVDKTKAMSKVQQNVVGGGNTMLPYGVKDGNYAMNENNNMDKKDKMKRLVFKKPFNGLSNALNLIPESYRVDDKEFEMTDGNESYKVRWEGTLTEGRAIVLMGSNKKQVNEDIAKIKHLMGYSSEKSLGTLKGNQRIDENKRFADIWGKTKSLLTESEDIEDQDAPEGEWEDETKKAAEATKHVEGSVSKEKNYPNTPAPKNGQFADVKKKAAEATKHIEGSVSNEKNYPNTPSVKTGDWDKAVKGQAADAKKHVHMNESYMLNDMPKDVQAYFDKLDSNSAITLLLKRINTKQEVVFFMDGMFETILSLYPELASSINQLIPMLKDTANDAMTQPSDNTATTTMEENYMDEEKMYESDRLDAIFEDMDEEGMGVKKYGIKENQFEKSKEFFKSQGYVVSLFNIWDVKNEIDIDDEKAYQILEKVVENLMPSHEQLKTEINKVARNYFNRK